MMLSVLAFYLISYEITQTQWFRRLGIDMVQERLQALVLALVLGSFCLVVPFRNIWTNYWLLHDGRQLRAVVVDFRDHGTVGYRYRVNGNDYTASGYPYEFPRAAPGESITVYYSASHPSISVGAANDHSGRNSSAPPAIDSEHFRVLWPSCR